MKIRKVSEPFKHLSGEPAKVLTLNEALQNFGEPAKVIPISQASGYNRANKSMANSGWC